MSTAGVFVSLRYFKNSAINFRAKSLDYFYFLGFLLLFFVLAAKGFNFVNYVPRFDSTKLLDTGSFVLGINWNHIFIHTMGNSLVLGLISSVIFFYLGVLCSLIYKTYSTDIPKIYFFDLLGASAGCAFGVFSLNVLQLSSALILLALFCFLICLILSWSNVERGVIKIRAGFYFLICLVIFLFNIKTEFFEIQVKCLYGWHKEYIYKELKHQWNAYSRASLFLNEKAKQPYLKYAFSVEPGGGIIRPFIPGNPYHIKLFSYLDFVNLGFLTKQPRSILILMAGTGSDMIEAYSYSKGTADITGVELNPIVVKMGRDIEGYHLTDFFARKNVHMIVQEGRSYMESTDKKFDSIVLAGSGSSTSQYLGVAGPTIQYLYTKEAFKSYLSHLNPGGTITVSNGNKIKVVAMAKAALEELGYDNVANKIIIISSKQDMDQGNTKEQFFDFSSVLRVLIKNTDFTKLEISQMQKYLSQMNVLYVYNPFFSHKDFKIFEDLLKSRDIDRFLKTASRRYNEDLSIPTDNTPFIRNRFLIEGVFQKDLWRKILEGDWEAGTREAVLNFSMIIFTFFLVLLGLLLIIFPLLFNMTGAFVLSHVRSVAYFSGIGLGFIFTEIALMQSLALLLGNPIYAFSVVLFSILIATALGSALSDHLFARGYLSIRRVSVFVAFILCSYSFMIPWFTQHGLPSGFFYKLNISLLLIFPAGFFLGMLFPQGLKKLGVQEQGMIPWAWGLNGYMSIVGSALSITLSRLIGFSSLMLIAAVLYFIIAMVDYSQKEAQLR